MGQADSTIQEALFGRDLTGSVVALEPAGQFFRLFIRTREGVTFQDVPFRPFALLDSTRRLQGSGIPCKHQTLEGSGRLCQLVSCDNWHDLRRLRDWLQRLQQTDDTVSFQIIPDSTQQFMMSSGITLFKEMAFEELRLLCIEPAFTTEGRSRRLEGLAVSDGMGFCKRLGSQNSSEAELLEDMTSLIRQVDPDVIAGYTLLSHDLAMLLESGHRHSIKLNWGRNGSEPHLPAAGSAPQGMIYGRNVIEIHSLVRRYDRSITPLHGTGPDEAAAFWGIDHPLQNTAPQTDNLLCAANRSASLYRLLAPLWFYQARMFPFSFQNLMTTPGPALINSLLLRDYLTHNHAVPMPEKSRHNEPEYQLEPMRSGRVAPVVFSDLANLHTTIMQAYRIVPAADERKITLPLLAGLNRLCKQLQDKLPPETVQCSGNQLQKLLMPAWYEQLSAPGCNFADPQAAREVGRLSRVLLKDMLVWLREHGAVPAAVEQHGLFFKPPPQISNTRELETLLQQLAQILPGGVTLRPDCSYRAMYVYKPGNYALLGHTGHVILRGSSLVSRSLEPFLRAFMEQAARHLLDGKPAEIRHLYEQYTRQLVQHAFPIDRFVRSEVLHEDPEQYANGIAEGRRHRTAAYEVALAEPPGSFKAGDRVAYYITGNGKGVTAYDHCRLAHRYDPAHPDLNIAWYQEKLDLLYRRVEQILPPQPSLFD